MVGRESEQEYVYENTIQLVDSNYVYEQRTRYRELDAMRFPMSKPDTASQKRGIIVYGTMHWWLGFNAGLGSDYRISPFQSLSFGLYF